MSDEEKKDDKETRPSTVLTRRQFLRGAAIAGACAILAPVSLKGQPLQGVTAKAGLGAAQGGKVALEEHYLSPFTIGYLGESYGKLKKLSTQFIPALTDFGERRLEAMDRNGITLSVLGSSSGVLRETDAAAAIKNAKGENDFLAKEIQKHPTRYAGFATLPMQFPKQAADELERCVKELGFKGALVNGHIQGHYLDEAMFLPFWERLEALGVPLYLHPGTSFEMPHIFKGRDELLFTTWNWTVETSTHTLRMVFGGVFDRFPKATLILGHMGETLPYMLWRLDSRWKLGAAAFEAKLKMLPSEYLKRNLAITTSGVFSNEPFLCALSALGEEKVMFAVDYPYESSEEAAQWLDKAPVSRTVHAKVAYGNARRLLKLV
jgi:2,3-dihydroxybenzoate decarboxylase